MLPLKAISRNPNADESLSRFEVFSQELRLTGATDKVDWMVGMFYADEDLTRNESYRIGPHYEPYVSTLIANLVAEYGRDGFLAAWLRSRDAGWAVDLIPTFPIPQAEKES